jgi:Replication protein
MYTQATDSLPLAFNGGPFLPPTATPSRRQPIPDPLQCVDNGSTHRNTPSTEPGCAIAKTEHDPYKPIPRAWLDERYAPLSATRHENAFRHSFWAAARERTRRAMVDAHFPVARRFRFQECGASCGVYVDTTTLRTITRSANCHDRWCAACGRQRRQRLAAALSAQIPKSKTLALVLTPKSQPGPLGPALTSLVKNFATLRRRKWWSSRVAGGAWVAEMTYNATTKQWHPHLHILVHASWLQLQEFSAEWHKVTGDSHRVHVSLVRDSHSHHAVRELCKYVGKIAHRSWEHDQALLAHAMKALHGRRLEGSFGSWKHVNLQQPLPGNEKSVWVFWGTLDHLYALSSKSHEEARAILKSLLSGEPCAIRPACAALDDTALQARPPPHPDP